MELGKETSLSVSWAVKNVLAQWIECLVSRYNEFQCAVSFQASKAKQNRKDIGPFQKIIKGDWHIIVKHIQAADKIAVTATFIILFYTTKSRYERFYQRLVRWSTKVTTRYWWNFVKGNYKMANKKNSIFSHFSII